MPFNYGIYVGHPESRDLAALDEAGALRHYENYGRTEGRICSEVEGRKDFIGLLPPGTSILEIGPFFSPAFRRPEANVSYLDCLSTEAMKARAEALSNEVVDTVPEIDYVWTGLSVIGSKIMAPIEIRFRLNANGMFRFWLRWSAIEPLMNIPMCKPGNLHLSLSRCCSIICSI